MNYQLSSAIKLHPRTDPGPTFCRVLAANLNESGVVDINRCLEHQPHHHLGKVRLEVHRPRKLTSMK
jgi:hypothetical protein